MLQILLALIVVTFVAAVPADAAEPRKPEQILLAGSGANIPPLQHLIQAFRLRHPDAEFVPPENIGSSGAIRAAADGAIPLGLISRPLSPEEKKLPLVVVPYAATAVVVAVHPDVPDTDISSAALAAIYSGKKTMWKDGQPIVVFSREPNESTVMLLEDKIAGFRQAYRKANEEKRWPVLMKEEVMSTSIQETPGSIGFSDMGAIRTMKYRIKPLRLNGIAPTQEAVASGRYPLVKTLLFVYRKDRITPQARQFLQFVLSKEGRTILSKQGYYPTEDQ